MKTRKELIEENTKELIKIGEGLELLRQRLKANKEKYYQEFLKRLERKKKSQK